MKGLIITLSLVILLVSPVFATTIDEDFVQCIIEEVQKWSDLTGADFMKAKVTVEVYDYQEEVVEFEIEFPLNAE